MKIILFAEKNLHVDLSAISSNLKAGKGNTEFPMPDPVSLGLGEIKIKDQGQN